MAIFNNIDSFITLRDAIDQANSNAEADVINLSGNVTVAGLLPLINETNGLTINGGGFTISGDANNNGINDLGDSRLFFVNQGTVSFNNLTLNGGRALGGSGGSGGLGGGGGMGAGAALFVNSGNVTATNVNFTGNQAIGGNGGNSSRSGGSGGGGGFGGNGGSVLGNSNANAGGGGFSGNGGGASSDSANGFNGGGGGGGGFSGNGTGGTATAGGTGGSGVGAPAGSTSATNGTGTAFGSGGGVGGGGGGGGTPSGNSGGAGGFGGGGGGNSGAGGDFGGGGSGGRGGFGGGGGSFGVSAFGGGSGGFGGSGAVGTAFGGAAPNSGPSAGPSGGGAGLGGAIFIRNGALTLDTVSFTSNATTGGIGGLDVGTNRGASGQAKGGAVFVNIGATITTTGVTYTSNSAVNAGSTAEDNANIFINSIPNQAPTNLNLSNAQTNENVPANTPIGTLSSTDPDAGNTFTYSLVAGTGDADNAAFSIAGNQLRINTSPDFETKSSYTVRVRTTDQGGLMFERPLTITINDVMEADVPSDINLSNSTVAENVAANTAIGTLSSVDPNAGDTFTYTLVAGTGDADNSAFVIVGDQLRITASPDFETKPNLSIRVRTTDQTGLTYDKVLAIAVTNLNESPTNLNLSSTQVAENVAANTVIGTFATVDPDTGNTFTYSLVTGTGDTDNTAFAIVGNQLQINVSPDFETKASYNLRVRTTDQAGLTFEKPLTVTVQDVAESFSQFVGTQAADGLQIGLSQLQQVFDNQLLQANIPIVGKLTGTIPNFLATFRDQLVPAIRSAGNISVDAMETLLNNTLSGIFPGAQVVKSSNTAESTLEVTINQQNAVTKVANDLALPGLGLRVDNATGQGSLNSQLKLVFGSNRNYGFFIDSDRTRLTSNLNFGLGTNFNASGKMGLYKVKLQDDATNATRATAAFSANLRDIDAIGAPNDGNHLTTSELQTNATNAALRTSSLTSDPNLGIKISTDMGAAAIPGINTTLAGDLPVLTYGNGAWLAAPNTFAFKNTEMSLGSIANNIVLPVLKRVDSVIAPMRPVLNAFSTDLKSVGIGYIFPDVDKDGKVTLLDLAAVTGNPALGFFKSIQNISDLSKRASASSNSGLSLGNFSVTNFDAFGSATSIRGATVTQTSSPLGIDQQLNSNGDEGSALIKNFKRLEGVKFDLFDSPNNAVKMLIGQPVNLFSLDAPELELSFSLEAKKNIGTTPFVLGVGGSVFATADLAFGYDTFGLQQWADTNYDPSKTSKVFDGFYISDRENPDGTGADVSELQVGLGINLSGGVGLALKPAVDVFGGLVGGVKGGPLFDFKDPNNDGKVRGDELIAGNPLNFSGVSVDASIGAEVSASAGPLTATLLSVTFLEANLFKFDPRTNQIELLGLPARDLIKLLNDGVNKIKRAGLDLALRGGKLAIEATKKAIAPVVNVGKTVTKAIVGEFKSAVSVANKAVNQITNTYNNGKAAEDKLKKKGIASLTPKEIASVGVFRAVNLGTNVISQVRNNAAKVTVQAASNIKTAAVSTVTNTASSVKKGVKSLFRKVFNEDIADGILFFDKNFNGVLDEGEPFTVTYDDGSATLLIDFDEFDTNQNGTIDDTEGQQVAIGGYSPYTGLVSELNFVAPGDSFGINPFTTLVSQMMKDGKDQSEAIELVNQSMGLPADLDVGSFIPELALEDGDAALAAKFEATQSQVHTALVQISKLLDGASALSKDAIAPKVVQVLAAQVAAGTPINLGNTADIQKLLTASIAAVKAADPALNTAPLDAIVASVAQVIAESNQNITKASQVTPAEVLRSIGLTQRIVLGEIAKDLEAVGAGKKSIQSVLAESTGAGFTKLLAAAKKEMTDGSNRGDILRGTRKADVLRGQAGDDALFGDQGNDRLFGDADADELKGEEGNDLLEGGMGNDTLIGDAGRDRLIGGDGNDSLAGDSGKDTLLGGKGRDRFNIGISKADADRIADFSPREDLLVIEGLSLINGLKAGKLVKSKFLEVGRKAGDRNDYFVYNPSTGALFYDENGSVKGLQTKIAQLSPGLDLRANSLLIV
jgi:hypothetical protein